MTSHFVLLKTNLYTGKMFSWIVRCIGPLWHVLCFWKHCISNRYGTIVSKLS